MVKKGEFIDFVKTLGDDLTTELSIIKELAEKTEELELRLLKLEEKEVKE